MKTEPISERPKISFDILDSIRGIAALYVAVAHCRGTLWIGGNEFLKLFPRNTWNVWDYLMFGSSMLTRLAVEFVIVFFVLSGFSIAYSLSANKSPLQFYKRRFIRIYPSYVVALIWAGLVFLITYYWYPQWYNGTFNQGAFIRTAEMKDYFRLDVILKNLFYMPGHGFITPFWSLTYEVIFYLLAPFLMRRVKLYTIVSIVLFLINFISPSRVQSWSLPVYIYEFLFLYNIYFVAGVLLFYYYKTIENWFKNISKRVILAAIGGAVILMYAFNISLRSETVYSFLVAAVLSVLLILYFLTYQVRIKWLMGIGKFSYTLYITHFASVYLYLGFYWAIAKPAAPYILNYFVWMPAVLFCLLIAYLQYTLVEKRTKKVLSSLRKKPVPAPIISG
ncbi:MAG: acyltransferase [Bacteroidetes bacterium]|nr:acyltransferase [Bacteroidota bacterium]MBS1930856.1 acyltransferase [Bacteroidota bacterium]